MIAVAVGEPLLDDLGDLALEGAVDGLGDLLAVAGEEGSDPLLEPARAHHASLRPDGNADPSGIIQQTDATHRVRRAWHS